MRLTQLDIYGFGKWQNYKLELPDDKLIVINGQNESGKSTLRQFCLFILFGLPPKKREFFRPKTGGKMGGRITVAVGGEAFVIERVHERNNGEAVCYVNDGTTRGEQWLKQQLKGMDLETFQSIYSFDAEDLSYLDTIKEENLGDVLLGIGMTGTSKIYSIEKELESKINQRFKPQGKNPEINKQLNQLDTLSKELIKLQEDEGSYREKKQKEQKLEEELADVRSRLEEFRLKEAEVERQIQAVPLIRQLQHDQAEKQKYNDVSSFPTDGLERYYKWKEKILPLESELGVLETSLRKYQQQLKEVEQKCLPDNDVRTAEELSREAGVQQHQKELLQKKQKTEEHLQQELTAELNELQIGLHPDDLRELALPFHLEEEWSRLKEEQSELEMETENAGREKRTVSQQLEQLEREKVELQNKLIPAETLARLQQKIEERNNHEHKLRQKQRESGRKAEWMARQQAKRKASNWLFLFSLIIGTSMALVALVTDMSFLYVVAFLSILCGVVQLFWTRQNGLAMKQYLRMEQDQAEESVMDETEWQETAVTLEEQKRLRAELNAVKERLQQVVLQDLKLSERSDFYKQKRQLMERKISQQRLDYPFLKQVHPDYWVKLYHILIGCKQLQKQLDEIRKEMKDLSSNIAVFHQKTAAFIEENGFGEAHSADIVNFITSIVDEQKLLKNNSRQYEQWIERTIEQRQNLLEKIKPYQKEIEKLWALVPVADEESFLKAAEGKKAVRQLEDRITACYEKLIMLFPEQKIEDFLHNRPADSRQLEKERQEMQTEAENLERLLEEKRQNLSDIRAALAQMEQSESYSIMSHRFQLEKDHLREQIKQWAVYQTAKQVLEETKRLYQQEYLPEAIKLTSTYFAELTNGQYVRVFPPKQGNTIIVENKDGLRFDVKELSKGSRDQLYIALRFALNAMMNDQHTLPFFIDDGFVHFDVQRLNRMFKVLKQTAKNQQVILFTCQAISGNYLLPNEVSKIELA